MEAFSYEGDPCDLALVYYFASEVIIGSSLNLTDLNVATVK